MNLKLSFAFFTALLQLNLPTFGAEIPVVYSATHDVETLLQIADGFLYCFMDQSSKKFPPTEQTFADAVSRVIRSFAHHNNDSLSKADAIIFQTNLATSIADNVEAKSQQNDHPQNLSPVLQLISNCFTEIAGYQPSNLIRSITSFSALLFEDTYPEWNSLPMDSQENISEAQNSGDFVNQPLLKSSMENSKSGPSNEISQLAYDRRARQTPRSFAAVKSPLLAGRSSADNSLNMKINKRTEFDPFLNDGKQSMVEINDSFKVKKLETNLGTLQTGLNVDQIRPSVISLPASFNSNYSEFSITSQFSFAFSDALKSSYNTSKAFKTSLHPMLASKAYYNAIYNAVFGIESLNPVSVARIFSMAVKATFNDLSTFQHIMTYGNVIGKYLKSRGQLTSENVMMLSSSYVNFIKTAVGNVKTIDPRDAGIQAIIDGLVNFLVYLRFFPSVDFLDLATDFADNVLSFTNNRRNFASLPLACEGLIFNQIVDKSSNLDKSFLNVISQYRSTIDDMQVEISRNNNCSVISLFTHTFSETISVSEGLVNAFEKRLSGAFLSENIYSAMYDYLMKLGITNSSSHYISTTVSQLVNTSYYALTPVVITNTISNAIGRELFDQNLLSMKNFVQLSDSYIYFLESSFRSFGSNHTARSIITSILEGSGNFLSSQKISLAENVKGMETYFAMALNSSIESRFSMNQVEFSLLSPLDEVSTTTDFNSFGQASDAHSPEQPNTAAFSDYILDEILSYPHLSKLFYLPYITSPASDNLQDDFPSFIFSDSVDGPQHVADLIQHEIIKASGSLNSFSFAELFVKSLERFLTARYLLKPENSIVMARAFVSDLNEAVRQSQDSDYNLNTLISTTGQFLEKYLIFGVDHVGSWSSMLLSDLSFHPNFLLSRLINRISPEILSQTGLLSTKSSTRVNNLALAVREDILSSDEVNITSFTHQLIVGTVQISNDYPTLKPETAFIAALLEGTAALIGIINGAYITALDVWGYQNEASEMCEALSGFLSL